MLSGCGQRLPWLLRRAERRTDEGVSRPRGMSVDIEGGGGREAVEERPMWAAIELWAANCKMTGETQRPMWDAYDARERKHSLTYII